MTLKLSILLHNPCLSVQMYMYNIHYYILYDIKIPILCYDIYAVLSCKVLDAFWLSNKVNTLRIRINPIIRNWQRQRVVLDYNDKLFENKK